MSSHFRFRLLSLFVSLSFLTSAFLHAQEHGEVYRYARKIVDTLCSPSMHGRGYVNNGDKVAAKYLETQFAAAGLKNFHGTYDQKFSLNVNTFPGNGTFIGYRGMDKSFPMGETALVNCNSPACPETRAEIVWLDSTLLASKKKREHFSKIDFTDKVLVIDRKGVTDKDNLTFMDDMEKHYPLHVKGIVSFNSKRLMWDVASKQAEVPSFELLVPDSVHNTIKKQMEESAYLNFSVESKMMEDYRTQNIIGYIEGSQQPDSFIVFSAHYDHLGQIGDPIYFPGANDNASGCAMLLNLIRYYSMPGHQPKCSIAFIAFGAEEAGLVGSKYYTDHPLFPLRQIKFLVNMDIMGTGDEGITVVNGTIFPEAFKNLQAINDKAHYLPEVKIRGKAANSDHYFFSEKGVPSFFIYTRGGIKAYHDIYDKAETLPLTKFEDVFSLLIAFENSLESPPK